MRYWVWHFCSRIFSLWRINSSGMDRYHSGSFSRIGRLGDYLLGMDTVSQGQGVLEGLKSIYKAALTVLK